MLEGIVDMHCHVLPGVDDGPEEISESLELLRAECRQGVRKIIVTPHFRRELFETSREEVRHAFARLGAEVRRQALPVDLYLGCEFHKQLEAVRFLNEDSAYRMAGSRYVLLEFSGIDSWEMLRKCTTELLRNGYYPIIAHAERYPALEELRHVRYLVDSGARIQVNAGSILGADGFRVRRYCKKLLKDDYIHFVGSDAHDLRRRAPLLGKCAAYLEKKIGTSETRRILCENPEKIISNEYI